MVKYLYSQCMQLTIFLPEDKSWRKGKVYLIISGSDTSELYKLSQLQAISRHLQRSCLSGKHFLLPGLVLLLELYC